MLLHFIFNFTTFSQHFVNNLQKTDSSLHFIFILTLFKIKSPFSKHLFYYLRNKIQFNIWFMIYSILCWKSIHVMLSFISQESFSHPYLWMKRISIVPFMKDRLMQNVRLSSKLIQRGSFFNPKFDDGFSFSFFSELIFTRWSITDFKSVIISKSLNILFLTFSCSAFSSFLTVL